MWRLMLMLVGCRWLILFFVFAMACWNLAFPLLRCLHTFDLPLTSLFIALPQSARELLYIYRKYNKKIVLSTNVVN